MSSNFGTFSPPAVSHNEHPTTSATNESIFLLTLPAPAEVNHPKTRCCTFICTVIHFLHNKLCAFLNLVPVINIFLLGSTYGIYMAIVAHLWSSNPTIALVSTILNAVVILGSLLTPPSHWFKDGYDSVRQATIYLYLIVIVLWPCVYLIFNPVPSPDGSPLETENTWTPFVLRVFLLIYMVLLSAMAITFAMVFPGHGVYPYNEFRWRSNNDSSSSRSVSTFSISWKVCIESINSHLQCLLVWPRRSSRLLVDEEMRTEATEK